MKKASCFSFLLLANIALLAHIVIPHHHHSLEPAAMCTTHHEQKAATHSEDNENNGFENCLISHIYAKINNEKQPGTSSGIKLQPILFELFPCTGYSVTPLIASDGLPFRLKPYIPFASTEWIAQSVGLRAPPLG